MCFSASASFGAGIVLSVIGVASLKKAKAPSQLFLASIPLLFSVQQISEGFLWLSLTNPSFVAFRWPATYSFLFFAHIVWPFWVPLSVLALERNEGKRKKLLRILLGIGSLVSVFLTYCLLNFPVEGSVLGYHISYKVEYPESFRKVGGLLYIIATIAPALYSSVKKLWTVGISILISYIITEIFYKDYIISVWCFFASVISIMVYMVIREMKRPIVEKIQTIKSDSGF